MQYFSSGLAQNGTDKELNTISGFLMEDVNKELRRGLKIKCSGCNQPGGYIGCAVRTCRKAGHFPCLHTLGYTFQHWGNFEAFCPKHCPTKSKIQRIEKECCICLTELCAPASLSPLLLSSGAPLHLHHWQKVVCGYVQNTFISLHSVHLT